MTYPTNKKQEVRGKRQDLQAGVTLLLAILVLSSIMAISFSLATILFIEVRTSGDLLRTEPAYYGASGVGEEATFNIKRNACTGTCTYTSNFGNNVTADTPVQTLVSTPIFQDRIPPNTDPAVNFASGKSYYIYDATAGLSSTGGSNYGKIVLNYVDNGQTGQPLQVYLCQYDPSGNTVYATPVCRDPDSNATPSYWPFANATGAYIDANTPLANRTWTLDPNMQQELILFNPNRNGNIYVSVETFDASGVPKGLPYSGETAVSIQTNNSAVGRRLLVVVPNIVSGTTANPPVALITAQSGSYTDSRSRVWCQDTACPTLGISGGTPYSTSGGIAGTTDAPLYLAQRYGNFTYTLTGLVPGSSHSVTLKFAEIYWSNPGQRVFNVAINGTAVLTNFDIVQDAGSSFKADDKTFSATADASGNITIQFITVIDNAEINSIEVD